MSTELDQIRVKIERLRSDIAHLAEDRATRDETAARIDAWVDDQAGLINSRGMVAGAAKGRVNDEGLTLHSATTAVAGGDVRGQLAPFLAWLDPAAMKARLLAELDANAASICGDKKGADRRAELTKKRKQLDAAEVEEEALIAAAEAQGYEWPRRAEARPEVILAKAEAAQ